MADGVNQSLKITNTGNPQSTPKKKIWLTLATGKSASERTRSDGQENTPKRLMFSDKVSDHEH